ncbi:MAG: hypothetical protein EOP84_01635 [Verrucomicrobiaceae bacterium]|uniref:imm11 family protein n=1 Tax=Corallococcus sp. BB11-1 TaxID=2996783 RepID=UPI0010F1E7BE|nr:DUF1629 domain-containing protein [Corallococcus sp. BB11-1]MCY1035887.1 hypothetical protein [Corallococcus sp. BB11-1]RYD85689.1 MAG: hypothetical protein EOP84_01635 [Verrucomicrobiaceae bacterium]
MKFYRWTTLGLPDVDQCFLDAAPKELGARSSFLARGRPVKGVYPQSPRIDLSEEHPGLRLESFIGNSKRMLVASRPLRTLLEEWCKGQEVEYLPVLIYNHRGRLHADDYSIINPLGTVDCIDPDRSEVTMMEGEIISVERIVLSQAKLAQHPHLFRVREAPHFYVISELLAEALKAGGFTNVVLDPFEVATP